MDVDLHWANIPPRHPAMSHGPAMMTRTASGQYEWGHYGNDRTAMEQDFTDRVQDYQRIYNVGIRQTEAPGLYKYYSTQRPCGHRDIPEAAL